MPRDALADAVTLAMAAHDGADWSIWSSRRQRYWEAFEANLRAAALTSDLGRWQAAYERKMGCRLGRNAEARRAVMEIMEFGDGAAILREFRERANLVTLHVRVAVDEKRALFASRALEDADDDGDDTGARDQAAGGQPALAGLDDAAFQPEPRAGG